MEPNAENSCRRDAIKEKLRQNFDGKIVRKDLTKKIKEGTNVPVYVLEFLLGQHCSSDDEEIIEQGVQNVSIFWRTTLCARTRRRRCFLSCAGTAATPLLIW